MKEPIMQIDPNVLEEALKQPTPFKYINADNFIFLYNDIEPIEGYEPPKNFPNCCVFHQSVYQGGKRKYDEFPDCCDTHRKMAQKPYFKKENFITLPEKVVTQISYTEHCLAVYIDKHDWYSAITDYIEWNLQSFGHPTVGADHYLYSLRHYIELHDTLPISADKREKLLTFLDGKWNTTREEHIDINELYNIYQKWLKVFPFGISYFAELKQYYSRKLPFVEDIPKVNQYSKAAYSKLINEVKLIQFLTNLTKDLLGMIDTSVMISKGFISDTDKYNYELLLERHRVVQICTISTFQKKEKEYKTIITNWLNNEKDFIKDVSPFLYKAQKQEPTKTNILADNLNKYGFVNLEKVKANQNIASLINKLSESELPYQIAMLDFLGFIPHLEKEHSTSKKHLYKLLSKILNVNERAVKGNISVLNEYSTEDKNRYTANQHKEAVKKYYQKIK